MSSPAPRLHRFRRSDFLRMIEAGVIRPDDPVELVDGQIWETVSPQSSPHFGVVCLVQDALRAAIGPGLHVRCQGPLALGAYSQPEPDLAVVEGGPRDHMDDHPTSARLIVEVSRSSLAVDRTTKRDLYAREDVGEYWIVNLVDVSIEIRADSDGRRYRTTRVLGRGDTIRPGEPGGDALARAIDVTAILP